MKNEWDRSAAIQREIEWKSNRDKQSRCPNWQTFLCKLWSGRLFESRADWSLSFTESEGYSGNLPEWHYQNFFSGDPLYTLRKCFHLGALAPFLLFLLLLV